MRFLKQNLTAFAILIGLALVAGVVYVSGTGGLLSAARTDTRTESSPIRSNDAHRFVYGDPDAAVTVVEFSDFECPFCGRLHPTLKRLVTESGGAINWEYRHFPLPSHRNAERAAAVGECVGRIEGNDAFWEFSDTIFMNQSQLSDAYLTEVAGTLGVAESDLDACTNDPEIEEQIATDLAAGRAFGGNGTPFSVIVFPDGSTQPVSGALPYANWEPLLNL